MNELNRAANTAFQLKGSLFTLTMLHLQKSDPVVIHAQLSELIKKSPNLFNQMPIVIDLATINALNTAIDLVNICNILKQHGLIIVGLRNVNAAQEIVAKSLGIGIFNSDKISKKNQTSVDKPSTVATKIVNETVRSGQQIYSKNSDLVITANVSAGAEVMADGHIHIYGELRGRALAGMNNNPNAKVFCLGMQAELIAIAGFYQHAEQLEQMAAVKSQAYEFYLADQQLSR